MNESRDTLSPDLNTHRSPEPKVDTKTSKDIRHDDNDTVQIQSPQINSTLLINRMKGRNVKTAHASVVDLDAVMHKDVSPIDKKEETASPSSNSSVKIENPLVKAHKLQSKQPNLMLQSLAEYENALLSDRSLKSKRPVTSKRRKPIQLLSP